MPSAAAAARSLSGVAFATLVTIAFVMGANHVAARLAFNDGVTVTTAVLFRSVVTALVVLAILRVYRVPLRADARQRRALLGVGLLVGAQSLCLYSAVARLPVALALLAFNSYPLWVALWARVCYGERTDRRTLLAMPVMLLGLALALDVSGAASGMGAVDHWSQIGAGVAYALAAAAAFGLALVLTQHGTAGVDGRVRTAATMSLVGVMALVGVVAQGGPTLPVTPTGWWGLIGLTALYGTGITIMFTVLPRLGVVGNSAIMNVEPIFALALAWAVLGQAIAPVQVAGGLIVVATVMWLGLRRS